MSNTNFQIRLATEQDIDSLTELHCLSFTPDEHVPVMLGRNYVRATYRWQVTSDDAYVLVAEEDSKIIGLVAVCDGAFTKPMFYACLPEFILSILTRPVRLFRKMLWQRLLRSPGTTKESKKLIEIYSFAQMTIGAIDKDYRGSSIFGALIQKTKEYSKKRGSRAIRAGIYKTNKPSRRVFIKSGWIETPELETNDTVFYVAFLEEGIKDLKNLH